MLTEHSQEAAPTEPQDVQTLAHPRTELQELALHDLDLTKVDRQLPVEGSRRTLSGPCLHLVDFNDYNFAARLLNKHINRRVRKHAQSVTRELRLLLSSEVAHRRLGSSLSSTRKLMA
jgi:hypothetical protein